MLERVVEASIRHRWLVVLLSVVVVAVGGAAFRRLSMDAVPDVTTVQVQVATRTAPMSAVDVERYVTYPVELALTGLPEAEQLRSVSRFGLSVVTVVFREHVDVYFARQLVAERLGEARDRVPREFGVPEMLPVTTGLGEVYMFTVEGAGHGPMELRELLDWEIAPRLRAVPGVVEVSAGGGLVKQYHVVVDPRRLVALGLGVEEVFEALKRANAVAGGGYVEQGGEAHLIRATGLIESLEDLRGVVVVARGDVPITVGDVADVRLGATPRLGASTVDGEREAVTAMVLMLKDANARQVARDVDREVEAIRRSLPDGVRIETFYDRSELVDRVVRTVRSNLVEGALLVVAVLLLLLGNLRGGLLVASVIPLAMLVAFTGMVAAGISGNLMSLGAIDFGIVVDGAVVMVENMMRRSAHARASGADPREAMRLGAREVARPVAFAVGIILVVYVPVLALQGTEGKMFRPMAFTVMFAVAAALALALTLIPAATTLALPRGADERETWLLRIILRFYEPLLDRCLRRPRTTAGVAAAVFACSLALVPFLGSEFIPRLDEGDLVIQSWRLPSISLEASVRGTLEVEKTLRGFPEVQKVVSRTGTPEVATDVMGMEMSDVFIRLRPAVEWTSAATKEQLVERMKAALNREVPGAGFSFTQPIEMRFNELVAGVRSDVAVKIFGDDLDQLGAAAERVAAVLSGIRGARDVRLEQTSGQSIANVRVDRPRLARLGIGVEPVLNAVEAAGAGHVVGRVFEGRRQFELAVRLAAPHRQDEGPEALADLPVAAGSVGLLPLRQVATIEREEAPAQVSREAASRRVVVECNVRGRDLGGFVAEARAAVDRQVRLPPGYFARWGGQFENLERARGRLLVAVPLALTLIFVLLYLAFGAVRPALLVYANVPLAATGGILALFARGLPLSISSGVGFITLFGVAVLNGVVMISHVRRLTGLEGLSAEEAARRGALDRLRPVLMTALVASLGFVPMAVSTGAGAEVQRPLATVVIGGLVTSTLLTLLVVPAVYRWLAERRGALAP